MNEIVVLSGKGGTGKTSVAAALAILAGEDAVIADCDVDAANMHLLLRPDFANPEEFYSGELAAIDQEVCIKCGLCADICRFHAIPLIDNEYRVSTLDCEGCGYCEKVCPVKAISMHDRKSGVVYISRTRIGNTLVHAKLDIGAENSGKLVARVKNESKRIAELEGKQYILVDGSPGIGCPVVSSLSGANYVLLVTEPSISALHDLSRVVKVIAKFGIRSGCVINKCDLNIEVAGRIKDFLHKSAIEYLGDIPYNAVFHESMVRGETIVENGSPIRELLVAVWEKIKRDINH